MRAKKDEESFEDTLEKLEQTVHQLEDGGIPLADALAQYEQGIKHLKTCYAMLEHAQQRIEILRGVDAEGKAIAEPLETGESISVDQSGGSERPSPRSAKAAGSDTAVDENDIDDSGRLF